MVLPTIIFHQKNVTKKLFYHQKKLFSQKKSFFLLKLQTHIEIELQTQNLNSNKSQKLKF